MYRIRSTGACCNSECKALEFLLVQLSQTAGLYLRPCFYSRISVDRETGLTVSYFDIEIAYRSIGLNKYRIKSNGAR